MSLTSASTLMGLSGTVLDSGGNGTNGNLTVTIHDAAAAGNEVYNSGTDFNGAIVNGSYNVMLGSGVALNLTLGETYYLDLSVNGEDIDFSGNERQQFVSSVGSMIDATNITTPSLCLGGDCRSNWPSAENFTGAGNVSYQIGNNAVSSGDFAIALGEETIASGNYSVAIGKDADATGFAAVAAGEDAYASGINSMALGEDARAIGGQAHAFGRGVYAEGINSMALGRNINVSGGESIGIGFGSGIITRYVTASNVLALLGGNVGVGVANPTHELSVNGSVNITNSSGDAILCLNDDCISNWSELNGSGSADGTGGWNNDSMYTNTTRAVFINNSAGTNMYGLRVIPDAASDYKGIVVGAYDTATDGLGQTDIGDGRIVFSGPMAETNAFKNSITFQNLNSSGSINETWSIGVRPVTNFGVPNLYRFNVRESVGGSTMIHFVIQNTTGNVGIGYINPSHKLSVNGSVIIAANVTIGDVLQLGISTVNGSCTNTGAIKMYNDSSSVFPCFCNGTDWVQFQNYSATC